MTSEAKQLVDDVLNELPVTDRVFHGLKQSMPLVTYLIDRLGPPGPGQRVLVVGANTLLARAVKELGWELELWQVPEGTLIGELRPLVRRLAPLDEMLSTDLAGEFDAVILPYILEATAEEPDAVLARLRRLVRPGGRLIVASASAGRLAYRIRSLTGHTQLRPGTSDAPASLSWPALPLRRLMDLQNLSYWANQAGFEVRENDLIMDQYAAMAVDAMRLKDWVICEATHLIRRTVPGLQDCLVATLQPFDVQVHTKELDAPDANPEASVVVFASDATRTAEVIAQIREQTYAPNIKEVVVVHSGNPAFEHLEDEGPPFPVKLLRSDPVAGPRSANAALRTISGRVVAFTDDHCRLPPAWLQSGVAATSEWTAAATGEVLPTGDSRSFLLALPGTRETWSEELDRGFFPSWNSFYLKEALELVGGFDESLEDEHGPLWGWDSEVAHRLKRRGYETAFEETTFLFREFPPDEEQGWVRREYRLAKQVPAGIRSMPDLRRTQLKERVFVTHGSRAFDLLLLGVGLAIVRRRLRWLVLAAPWTRTAVRLATFWPPSAWPQSVRSVAVWAARHAVWFAGHASGSLRSRRIVL